MMKLLSETEILKALTNLDGWYFKNNCITCTFTFKNFKEAFGYMTRIAFEAERLNHHPDWSNVYNSLTIRLTTHDAGGVTEKDIELASIINSLVIKLQ